jgi:membrane-associated protein
MDTLLDLVLHLDRHLGELSAQYGPYMYAILFLVVFAETGLVVTPFLPGDSLLFAAGALGAIGVLNAPLTAGLLIVAAILGDAANYAAGRFIGPRLFDAAERSRFWGRLLKREHLHRTERFFERYGGKAVVLGRFAPIIRTFVPFVAGAAIMNYSKFATYNVAGALLWVGICLGGGYAFGNIPVVRQNFTLVTLGIIAVSLLPIVIEVVRARREDRAGAGTGKLV